MDAEAFVKKELKLRVIIHNLNSNLSYGSIIALLKKYDYYRTVQQQPGKLSDFNKGPGRDGR